MKTINATPGNPIFAFQKNYTLKQAILLVMAKHLHKNNFNPEQYLSSQD
jgi:hypothetical protein